MGVGSALRTNLSSSHPNWLRGELSGPADLAGDRRVAPISCACGGAVRAGDLDPAQLVLAHIAELRAQHRAITLDLARLARAATLDSMNTTPRSQYHRPGPGRRLPPISPQRPHPRLAGGQRQERQAGRRGRGRLAAAGGAAHWSYAGGGDACGAGVLMPVWLDKAGNPLPTRPCRRCRVPVRSRGSSHHAPWTERGLVRCAHVGSR
jgi:hypothetical protein